MAACNSCSTVRINNPCPNYPNAHCVVYTGTALSCIGAVTNERLDSILIKINSKLCATAPGLDRVYTTSDFASDTEMIDSSLNGLRFRIAWRGIGALIRGTEWNVITGGGFEILFAGFNVNDDPNNTFFLEFY
jgi:hypothetical protein